MAVGHSDDVDFETALAAVLDQCEAGLAGATPSAALLLAAFESDHAAILRGIDDRFPGIEIAGSSTSGEMTSVLGLVEDSIALAVFSSDTVDITGGLGHDLVAD